MGLQTYPAMHNKQHQLHSQPHLNYLYTLTAFLKCWHSTEINYKRSIIYHATDSLNPFVI